ncbi:DNA repair and recombination protein [Wickerhamomyces ciferrii]|uniref:ATP-dependent DNA helicase PIF1 n=1 Tax=Wickerhamomyces ciferrii (strain ATCC 14091 / BCRC 22168 / CBS 111 / JCM 3599 / NBRC 0793 / NRRL Y-1031 F-60-10) TaxID=1206466 RepID=K0KM86_WICCF|nr:DNA repair and recombination protein [Wickerhamomyces ciferrii]CCH46365.1 DNA repair and recombination protein [Wickerhamomyces ciferrii]
MDATRFYGTSVKKMKLESGVTSSPAKKKLEDADILALEESFSDGFSDDGSSLELKHVQPAVKQSPVKARNKEFEQDFNSDFTDDDVFEIDEVRPKEEVDSVPPPPPTSQSKISALLQDFSSPIDKSSQKIKISQLGKTSVNEDIKPLPKLTRFIDEDDFDDSFFQDDSDIPLEAPKIENKKLPFLKPGGIERASSSIAFTSSPSYHKTETVYKRVLNPQSNNNTNEAIKNIKLSQDAKNLDLQTIFDSFEEHSTNDAFPSLSKHNEDANKENKQLYPNVPVSEPTTNKSKDLYPSMDSYNERHGAPQQIKSETLLNSPPHATIPNLKESTTEPIPKYEDQGVQDFFKPKFATSKFETKSETKSIPNLLNRPKKRNAELLLLTQRPTIHHELQNEISGERFASTTSRSKIGDTPPIKTVQTLTLSEEQQHIIDLAKEGNSLFYTGSAGTGKSVLLRSMIKTMRNIHGPGQVHVTASTGLAACNIGGITLHSFAGIGLGKEKTEELIKRVRKSRKGRQRWQNCKVLFIDEISMIDGKLFDKLDSIAKAIKRNDEPFGGIQVIVCGDFFQLPPVSKSDEPAAIFCFDSRAWKECIKLTITLQKVFRQKGDMEFITMLNEMRLGKISTKSSENFRKLERNLPQSDVEPAELYSTRYEVQNANSLRLRQLPSEIKTYTAFDAGYLEDPNQREKFLSNLMAPRVLNLKKGAQVMMIKNIDETLVNGSLGKVIDFIDQETYLTYRNLREDNFMDNSEIEKAIEKVKFNPRNESTEEGPHPILEDTVFDFLNDFKSEDPEIKENIEMKKQLMNQLHESSRGKLLPLVKFLTPDGQSRTILVQPEIWEVSDEFERPLVTRMQVPLILAWALSIHKSQGQTLPRVRVNLKKIFEKGQAYVALSRAVSREGLQVLFFDEKKIWAHPKVIEFYNRLKSAQDARLELEGNNVNRSIDLEQKDIERAMANAHSSRSQSEAYHDPDFESESESDGKEAFVDASSPSQMGVKDLPYMTQDESNDNIIVNRRNFRKRAE